MIHGYAEVYRMLDKQRTALCIHDMPGKAATDQPNDVSFIYIRRHGTARAGTPAATRPSNSNPMPSDP